MGGGENGNYWERNPSTIGRIGQGASRDRDARDAGRRHYPRGPSCMSFERILILAAAGGLMAGCHLFGKLNPDCHTPQEYQHALSAPPLKVPAGLDSPNTAGALVIPAVT